MTAEDFMRFIYGNSDSDFAYGALEDLFVRNLLSGHLGVQDFRDLRELNLLLFLENGGEKR